MLVIGQLLLLDEKLIRDSTVVILTLTPLVQIRSQTQPPSVEGLSAKNESSHQISITWSAYTATTGEVLGFKVCLSKSNLTTACEILVPVTPDATHVSVPFLDTFTLYYISIEVSIADEGFSVPSYTQARTDERGYYF